MLGGPPSFARDSAMNFDSKLVRAEVRIDICVHKVLLCLLLAVKMIFGL